MFKDTFTLKKNAWYMRYMKATWEVDHNDFQNMCPFFWATLVSVVFAPIIWFGLGIIYFFIWIKDNGIENKNKRFAAFAAKLLEELKDDEKMREFARIPLHESANEKYWDFYIQYIRANDELYARYQIFSKEVVLEEGRLAKEAAEKARIKKAKRDRLYKSLSWLKPIGRIILFGIIGLFLYLIGKCIYFLWSHYNFDADFWKALVITFSLIIVGLLIILIIDYATKNISKERFKYLLYLLYPVFWLFEGLGIICKFLYQVLYKKNCPGITWK